MMTDQAGERSPSGNKALKQARLPFKVLDIKTSLQNNVPKKRKLSNEDLSKEAKILKKELETDTENDIKLVNRDTSDAQKLVDTANRSSEILKPVFNHENSDNVSVNEVPSSADNEQTKNCINSEVSVENCNVADNKSQTETADVLQPVTEDVENKNCSELLDTSVVSTKSMTCDEASSDIEGDSQNCSSIETEGISLNRSTCTLETDERSEVSEFDKSLCLSTASPEGENGGSTPATTESKNPEGAKRPGRRKSLEVQKHKEEKARIRAEKEKKLQEERDAKKREKEREKDRRDIERNIAKQKKKLEVEEKLKEKELKKAQKEAENEEKLKAQEEKKAKKMELLQAKIDEKKRKEEEKQRKKEEKQKEEEEKQRKLEEKRKLDNEVSAKSKAVFANFFIKGSSVQQQTPVEESRGLFKPFEVTKNMVLASITPQDIMTQFDKDNLDHCFHKQDTCRLYLEELKLCVRSPYRRKKAVAKTVCKDEESNDVIILEGPKTNISCHRAKLYQFKENVRPPYYGTWRKTSRTVTGRRPFTLDTVTFDYEVDSEEEWDEGGPGESLSGTEDEKESEDDYEVDNEFFVPHGYLSADEEKDEDVGVGTAEHQARLKMREEIFQEERKRKFSELKPRIIGCVWANFDGSFFNKNETELSKVLLSYRGILLCSLPILTDSPQKGQSPAREKNNESKMDSAARQNMCKRIPEEAMPHLIKLLHGNPNGRAVIEKEFLHYWTLHRQKEGLIPNDLENGTEKEVPTSVSSTPERRNTDEGDGSFVYNPGFSKSQLKITLSKISAYARCPDPSYNKCVWWVHEEVRAKYGCVDLPVPNKWNYVSRNVLESRGRKKALVLDVELPDKVPAVDFETPTKESNNNDNPNSILKFTRKMSPSERFEANLQAVSNKNETKMSKSSNSLLKFAFRSPSADNSHSKTVDSAKTPNQDIQEPNKVQDPNSKVKKEAGSILKFTRKITPVRIGSSKSGKKEESSVKESAEKNLEPKSTDKNSEPKSIEKNLEPKSVEKHSEPKSSKQNSEQNLKPETSEPLEVIELD